jgi:hypothetical protein
MILSLYFCLSAVVVLTVVGSIPSSHPMSAARFPGLKSAIIFNFISRPGVTLGPLARKFDFTNMGAECI